MNQLRPKAIWLFFLYDFLPGLLASVVIFFVFVYILRPGFFSEERTFFIKVTLIILGILIFFDIVYAIIAYFWAKIYYRNYRYELSDIAFKKEYGVISKKFISIPYEHIQNITIRRGIIERLLGFSSLYIQTAGGSSTPGLRAPMIFALFVGSRISSSSAEAQLHGLSMEEAERIRHELLQRAKI